MRFKQPARDEKQATRNWCLDQALKAATRRANRAVS
jgi:hypothetical protein